MRTIKKEKVIIALSGGVDSSVAAALLKRTGFDVIGVFMRFWMDPLTRRWNRCCSPEAEKRAKLVATKLNTPFYVLNFEEDFRKRIVDYFLKEHRAGRTPNPCVVCNKEIKFGLLLEKAISLGVDYVATGHYARKRGNKVYKLLRAKDKKKTSRIFFGNFRKSSLKEFYFRLVIIPKIGLKN